MSTFFTHTQTGMNYCFPKFYNDNTVYSDQRDYKRGVAPADF